MSFVHLHLHTEYSLLDGLIKIKPLVKKIKELGMNACAVTDHGNMYSLYEFWSECKKNEIKPILGCEVYIAPRSRFDKDSKKDKKRYHLTLLAKNEIGYHNLIKICSTGQVEGFYTKPRVDRETLAKYSEGIIATTGCASSPINRNLIKGNIELAYAWAEFFKEIYKENFYSEIQRNGFELAEKAIPQMLTLAKKFDMKVIATCDSHYLNKVESNIQEINWCIRDGDLLSDDDRPKKWGDEFYVKSHQEMSELFADMPEVVENTQTLADSIEFYSIKYDRVQPMYPNKIGNLTAFEMLRSLCYLGASIKFSSNEHLKIGTSESELEKVEFEEVKICPWWEPQDELREIYRKVFSYEKEFVYEDNLPILNIKIRSDIKERLDFEMKVIHDKGYDDYFLVVSDFLNWSKAHDIVVGVRGSVAGSLVAYTSGITDIDPLTWELYFERFLNPERPSPPDIDCDLQDDRRAEIVEYIENKYGKENCSLILALGRLKTRAAIRDVSRVMGIPLSTADKLSKMVVVLFGKPFKMEKMIAEVPEFASIINSDTKLIEMAEAVKKIEDMPRQAGVHACGLLITPKPVVEYVPLQLDSEGRVTCQLEMKPIEEMGLMKFDLLGLANFAIISNCLKLVREYHNTQVDIWKLPSDDKITFELLRRGDTDSVFQLESSGMKKYLKELAPTTLEDICFMCAAYRPGPMQFITPYINRKYGREKVDYLIPELEAILKNTFGFAIYQEQVIRIAVNIAGYSMGEADMLRRAMGKKVKEIMEAEGKKFIEKCVARGYSQEIAEKLYDYMKPFADYGFNKAHAAQYAMIAFQTAYLKAHYPIEFITSCLQVEIGDSKKLKKNIQTALNMGITVLAPDVNKSQKNFAIENGNSIRFGLSGIKSLSTKAVEEIIRVRTDEEFVSVDELIEKVGVENLTQNNLEILVKVGALDLFGNRKQLLKVLPIIYARYKKINKVTESQDSLFGLQELETKVKKNFITPLEAIVDFDDKQKISWENELLGTFFSNHPITKFIEYFDNYNYFTLEKCAGLQAGMKVRAIVLLRNLKKIRTKRDGKEMAFLDVEDLSAQMEAAIFSTNWEKFGKDEFVKVGETYEITARISEREKRNVHDGEEETSEKSLIIESMKLVNSESDLDISFEKIRHELVGKIEEKVEVEIDDNSEIGETLEMVSEALSQNNLEKKGAKKNESIAQKVKKLILDVTGINDPNLLTKVKNCLMNNPGDQQVQLLYEYNGIRTFAQVKQGLDLNPEVESILQDVIRWE